MAQLLCERRNGNIIKVDDHLEIEFRRTSIDPNHDLADVLPDDGIFPLHFLQRNSNEQQFDEEMCRGLYLHMSQSEAMWIKFITKRLYIIRIYLDNVNVVTGQASQVQGQQDYFVVPDQRFVNGYKSNINALTTQFRRPPYGADSTQQNTQTIRFEVTPSRNPKDLGIFHTQAGRLSHTVVTVPAMTVKDFGRKYELQYEDSANVSIKFTSQGVEIDDTLFIADCINLPNQWKTTTTVRGGPLRSRLLKLDTYPAIEWAPHRTTVFNVRMLNSRAACDLFGAPRFEETDKEEEESHGINGVLVKFDPEPTSTRPLVPFRRVPRPLEIY